MVIIFLNCYSMESVIKYLMLSNARLRLKGTMVKFKLDFENDKESNRESI